MPKAKILVCDNIAQEGLELLQQEGFEAESRTDLDHEGLVAVIGGYDALMVRSKTKVRADVIEAGTRLKVIGRAGVGVDNIDVPAATRHGVLVMNSPEGNTIATAELAISLLLALSRNIPQADRSIRAGQWQKSRFVGTELAGKTLGILGMGRIGRVVAERALGLKLRVLVYDPYLSEDNPPLLGIEICTLDRVLSDCDFLTIHAPLTDSTRHLLNRENFAKMKRGARIVCAARGGIIDEEALCEALSEGQLAGAALDVFEKEPLPDDHPFREMDQVVLTPHLGASTEAAQMRVSVDLARQVAEFLKNENAFNAVNAPQLSPEGLREVGPYLDLAQTLGSFAIQLVESPEGAGSSTTRLEILYGGPLPIRNRAAIQLATLVGVMRPNLSFPVNFVNAPLLARERGLEISERTVEEPDDFRNSVALRLSPPNGPNILVAGTVFGITPRLTRIDDFILDAALGADMLVTRHLDQPGVIGAIGTLLGSAGINIEGMQLGTTGGAETNQAVGILQIEGTPTTELLESIRQLEAMITVRYVHT